MASLTALLPVHNRGNLTADFIVHIGELLENEINLRVVIFDDGSTDKTIINARQVFPGLTLISLDGKAYWGGAINAISSYIQRQAEHAGGDEIYLLANDDIRFPSKNALFAGINAVTRNNFVCARAALVPDIDSSSIKSLETLNFHPERGNCYHQARGVFLEASQSSPSNVASTWAMLSTRDAWTNNLKVPRSIPHYLSDYWFTYNLVKLGFSLCQPNQFICYTSMQTTRNKPSISHSKAYVPKIRDLVRIKLEVTSPEYIPAWIEFFSQKPISLLVKKKLIMLWLRFAALRLLMYFSIFLTSHGSCKGHQKSA